MKKFGMAFFIVAGTVLTVVDHVMAGLFIFIAMIVMVASIPKSAEEAAEENLARAQRHPGKSSGPDSDDASRHT